MEKIIKNSLIVVSLFCAVWVCHAENELRNVIRKPVMESFCHPETQLTFEPRIDTFEKTMVRVNPLPEVGTSVSYESEDGALADVYIYRCDEPFREHAKKTIGRILESSKQCTMLQNITEIPGTEWKEDFLAARFRITAEGEKLQSRLVMFRRNGFTVKIRITYADDSTQEQESAEHFTDNIVKQKR